MRTKTVIKSAAACVLACGAVGIAATSATAAGATQLDPTGLPIDLGPIPAATQGETVEGNCPASFYTDDIQLVFTSGNAVLYQGGDGANVEGQALLFDNTTDSSAYAGHTHVWFTQKQNPNTGTTNPNSNGTSGTGNQQAWSAQTVSFNGSAIDGDGSAVTISGSFGGGTSASGNQSGWFHLKVTCTGFPSA